MTVKVTTPEPLEIPEAAEMLDEPDPAASVTVLPLTGLLFASFKVTVIVEVEVPSAVTLVGLAVTVDTEAETAPTVVAKLLLVPVIELPSVAVTVLVDAAVALAVYTIVATPLAFVSEVAVEKEPPFDAVHVTVRPDVDTG